MAKPMLKHAPAQAGAFMWERAALGGLIVLAALLALINLPYAPPTWFDEGSHLHVPKTLVRHGVYADISSEGFRYFGPTIGVGPTVMLPVALAFQLAEVGLLQARLVMVAYLALALTSLFLLARRLYGFQVALLALLLALSSRTLRFEGMVEYGRQVLGEVPGVAFLLLGLLAYASALHQPKTNPHPSPKALRLRVFASTHVTRGQGIGPSPRYALLAGLAFGMALVTKNQFVLIVPPTLVLLAALDWLYYRAGNWWLRLAPPVIAVGCFGAWTLIMLTFFGPDGFAANLAKTRQAAGGAIFVFDLEATRRAVVYLVQVYGGLLIPGLLYSLWRSRERSAQALARLAPSLMALLWLSWFVTSLGWARYAFPAVILGAIAVAAMVADLLGHLAARRQRLLAGLAMAYVALAILLPLSLTTRVILSPNDAAQRMASYLDQQVPLDVLIETWEPELGLLTDHTYHYVPTELLDPAVRHQWLGGPPVQYAGLAAAPPYVLVGPFGSYTGIYPAAQLARDYDVVFTAEPYVLLQRRP